MYNYIVLVVFRAHEWSVHKGFPNTTHHDPKNGLYIVFIKIKNSILIGIS